MPRKSDKSKQKKEITLQDVMVHISKTSYDLSKRIDNLDKKLTGRIDGLENRMDGLEYKMEKRFEEAKEHRTALQEDMEETMRVQDKIKKEHDRRLVRLER